MGVPFLNSRSETQAVKRFVKEQPKPKLLGGFEGNKKQKTQKKEPNLAIRGSLK